MTNSKPISQADIAHGLERLVIHLVVKFNNSKASNLAYSAWIMSV